MSRLKDCMSVIYFKVRPPLKTLNTGLIIEVVLTLESESLRCCILIMKSFRPMTLILIAMSLFMLYSACVSWQLRLQC